MTDKETAAAIEAMARRVRQRDTAMREGGDYADADVFALDELTALRGRGWRPTAAKTSGLPLHAPAGTADKPRSEMLADLRADMEARAARDRAAKETRGEVA
jgi:hypothetical protein